MLIVLGGGLGSLFRYGLSTWAHVLVGRSFPYGTLLVNILGCFIIGLLTVILLEKLNESMEPLNALLVAGFLGGFTTFSSFSIETLHLFKNGDILKGSLNICLTLVLCMFAVLLGSLLGQKI